MPKLCWELHSVVYTVPRPVVAFQDHTKWCWKTTLSNYPGLYQFQYSMFQQCCNFTCSGLREYAQLWYKIQAEHRHRWGREFTSSCSCSSRSLSSTTRYDPSSSNSQPSLPYSWIIETLSTELIVVFLSPQSNTCQQRKEIPQLNRHSLFQNFKNQLSSSRNIKKRCQRC